MAQLAETKKSLKDLIFGKKLRKFRVVDPIDLMYEEGGETRKRGFWKTDPVHPTAGGYQALLDGVIKKIRGVMLQPGLHSWRCPWAAYRRTTAASAAVMGYRG
jgi:hypothetical protein